MPECWYATGRNEWTVQQTRAPRDLLAATCLASRASAMAGAMKPRPVPPAAGAELLALIGEFAVAEESHHAHVDPGAGDVATEEARDVWQSTRALHLERLDALGEQLNERIESIVGAFLAALVLLDGRTCLALKAAGPDGSSHVRPLLLEPNQIARLR
jgi:hypothetical protein